VGDDPRSGAAEGRRRPVTRRPRLYAHTRDRVIEIPLTGEPEHDALLERLAHLGGGAVTRDTGELAVDPADDAARAALQDGA
jgi:hypothetical protein